MNRSQLLATVFIAGAVAVSAKAIAQEPVEPIAPVKEINLARAELGKKLYFDPRLSKSGFISCNSCHNLSLGGSDNLKTSSGPLAAGTDQFAHGPELEHELGAILGWSSGEPEGTGGWPDRQSRRDGLYT